MQGYRPEIPVYCPKDWKDLIEACWQGIAARRPNFEEIQSTLMTIREYYPE